MIGDFESRAASRAVVLSQTRYEEGVVQVFIQATTVDEEVTLMAGMAWETSVSEDSGASSTESTHVACIMS
jgi:hypothetical protein